MCRFLSAHPLGIEAIPVLNNNPQRRPPYLFQDPRRTNHPPGIRRPAQRGRVRAEAMTRSDKEFYELFVSDPSLLKLLIPIRTHAPYQFRSETVKALERRLDGCFDSQDPKDPLLVLEIQARKKEDVYPRIIIEMAMLGLAYPQRDVKGVILFLTASQDPETKPWVSFARTCKRSFRVVYLDKALERLAKQDPDHPVIAVFQPLLEHNTRSLKQQAARCYDIIQKANYPEEVKDVFERVFLSWMMQRFSDKDYKEVAKMFELLTPLEETRGYKSYIEMLEERDGYSRAKAKKALELVIQEKEKAVAQTEYLGSENKRLLAMLKKAGIDPT